MSIKTKIIVSCIGAAVIIAAYLAGDTDTARAVLQVVLRLVGV